MMIVPALAALLLSGDPVGDAPAFATLKALAGTWRQIDSDQPMTVRYALIANETAVTETWRSPSGRETMTLYTMDGPTLIATHYCAQGNQPTLALTPSGRGLGFTARSITGLDAGEAHLVRLTLAVGADGRLRHSETYVDDRGEEEETRRVFGREP